MSKSVASYPIWWYSVVEMTLGVMHITCNIFPMWKMIFKKGKMKSNKKSTSCLPLPIDKLLKLQFTREIQNCFMYLLILMDLADILNSDFFQDADQNIGESNNMFEKMDRPTVHV